MSPQISRKTFLRLAASLVPALASGYPVPLVAQAAGDPERRERIADIFRMYHFQGTHRTATTVDNESGQWLAGEASRAGAEVTPRRFPIERIDLRQCFVEAGGVKREALPFFDGGFTGPEGVTGRLGAPGSGAPLALVTLDAAAIGTEGASIAELRRNAAIKAIVAITKGGSPGLCPSNAVAFSQPYGAPVVQVSSTAEDWLNGVARDGTPLMVVANVARTSATADNVLATVRGRRPDLAPVVVMTPRSGWWQCASERGGGIACWLEAMRAVALVRPDRTVRFLASSGHELGHLGLDAFLHEEPALIKSAAAWVHLGANIGAKGGRLRLQSVSDEMETLALDAFAKAGARVDTRAPRNAVPRGEARNIHVGGGRYVSLLGTNNPLFHNPLDLWPYAVDLEAAELYAAATVELVLQLSRA
jgi:hypothetical protein